MTGMWADPVVGQPEWSFLGGGSAFGLYHRFGRATARGVGGFVVYRDDHWLVDGTGLRYGDVLGAKHGVVGYETVGCPLTFDDLQLPVAVDRADLAADIEIVAFTPSSNLGIGEYPKSIAALSDQGDLEFIAERIYGDTSGTEPGPGAPRQRGDVDLPAVRTATPARSSPSAPPTGCSAWPTTPPSPGSPPTSSTVTAHAAEVGLTHAARPPLVGRARVFVQSSVQLQPTKR